MPSLNFQIAGLDALRAKLQGLVQELPNTVARATYQWAEDVMAVSKEIVPVKTGRLMNTGFVSLPVQEGSQITVVLGYGTDYALPVHEDTFGRHGSPATHWTRPGSGPKYLENPLKEAQGSLTVDVGQAILQEIAA